MTPEIRFFPVGNGDMTLIRLASGRSILIDCNIRKPGDDVRDVMADLRPLLKKDLSGRPYVDVMVLSHPDEDHCRGLIQNFHLAPLKDYDNEAKDKKIVIREMWSSPVVYRRACTTHKLCDDAKAWNKEAKRRVNLFKTVKKSTDGDRILILGEDIDGKTEGAKELVIDKGEVITQICGTTEANFSALLLAPLVAEDCEEEERLSKNNSSVILNYTLGAGKKKDAVKFLSAGDAEVLVWETLWSRHKREPQVLQYNLLQAPHHCSWHSLSWDSWSALKRDAKVSSDAHNALSQTLPGAQIVASSCPIKDDDKDPPCIRAKEEYVKISNDARGAFWNTSAYPNENTPQPLVFEVTEGGLKQVRRQVDSAIKVMSGLGTQPLAHG